ncbi:MAG: EamA family transporter [Candidatus Micrarchaeota archaeon]|nr:EamA family transporter [Candidatus Micrarchaeota archaeon]
MDNWVLFAIGAMLLFSISNTLLKVASDKFDLVKSLSPLLPAVVAAIVVFALAAFYLASSRVVSISPQLATLLLGVVLVSLLGVALFIASLKSGKIAEVTAVLSLSTIVVALISSHFLSIEFSLKEIAGMVLAVASIVLFVL